LADKTIAGQKSNGRCTMALMTWREQYSVGVETLDNQHKALLRILNEIHAASMRGKANEVAGPLLSKLAPLAGEHFSAEERLMESIKFPGLAEHRARHREMAGKIADLASRHEKRDTAVYLQLLYLVRDYQSKHMQNEDRKYAQWLSAHGIK
jgi:hemerythrin